MTTHTDWTAAMQAALGDGTHLLWDPRSIDTTALNRSASFIHLNKRDGKEFAEWVAWLKELGAIEKEHHYHLLINPAQLMAARGKEGIDQQRLSATIERLDALLTHDKLKTIEQTLADDKAHTITRRVETLRAEMKKEGLSAFIQPLHDDYFSEHPPASMNRFAYLTGLDVSDGTLLLTEHAAIMFLDGRYAEKGRRYIEANGLSDVLQVETIDPAKKDFPVAIAEWIKQRGTAFSSIGIDPTLHTSAEIDTMRKIFQPATDRPTDAHPTITMLKQNLVDRVWALEGNRPAVTKAMVTPFPESYTGGTIEQRIKEIAAAIEEKGADYMLVTDPSSIAWLLHVRGADVRHTPLPQIRALVSKDRKVELYMDPSKLSPEVRARFEEMKLLPQPDGKSPVYSNDHGVDYVAYPEDMLQETITYLSRNSQLPTPTSFLYDPDTTPVIFSDTIKDAGGKAIAGEDPIRARQFVKTPQELECIRNAHLQDGIAMTKFLHWMATDAKKLPPDERTEARFAQEAEKFRKERPGYKGQSFETISAAGENAPIIHYSGSAPIPVDARLYLIDSGAQYFDGDKPESERQQIAGTTDITRVIALKPNKEDKDAYTRVLKAHIALATAHFDDKTSGETLDTLARTHTKFGAQTEGGYGHGTGHGIDCYGSVHGAAPAHRAISKKIDAPLAAGMVVSNEPGYYDTTTQTGIRLENLLAVQAHQKATEQLSFETLTLVPFDLSLINHEMLSEQEINWINAYHKRVRDVIGPHLDKPPQAWLEEATQALPPHKVKLSEYAPSTWDVNKVNLHFDIQHAELVHLTNTTRYTRKPNTPITPLVLNGPEQEGLMDLSKGPQALVLNGRELVEERDYRIDPQTRRLSIHAPEVMNPENRLFKLEIKTDIYPKKNKSGSGLYFSSEGTLATQCESEGFRNMTYAIDRPDMIVKDGFSVTIDADKATFPQLIANGGSSDHLEDLKNGRHRAQWEDTRPKPFYLFAMGALNGDIHRGTYTYPEQAGGHTIRLETYTEKGKGEQAGFAMGCLKEAMQFAYDRWGHVYNGTRYQKDPRFMTLSLRDYNMGAMENNGLNVFNDIRLLGDRANATDERFYNIDRVVAHEYFHDQTGNWRIPANWFQIAYKEGLTVFGDQTYIEHKYDAAWKRIHDVMELRSRVFAEDAAPGSHPMILSQYAGVMSNYDSLTYPKGAHVNRMLELLVGPAAYDKAARKFHDTPHPETTTVEDYFRFIAKESGKDLSQFIETWTQQRGIPTLEVDGAYDASTRTYTLHVKQHAPENAEPGKDKPFLLPFKVGLVDPSSGGKDIPLKGTSIPSNGVLEIKDREQTFVFSDVPCDPLLSLNRDFTSYAKVTYPEGRNPSREKLAQLAACDPNGFKRWDALQELATAVLQEIYDAKLAKKDPPAVDPHLISAMGAVLDNPAIPPLLKSELLKLPLESTLSNLQAKEKVDPIAIHETRDYVRKAIGAALETKFLHNYESSQSSAEYQFTPAEMGRRSLMNLSLGYLVATGKQEHIQRAATQFYHQGDTSNPQRNYNDTAAAATILALSSDKEKAAEVLKALETYCRDDHLVLNEWLGMSIASNSATMQDVKALRDDKTYFSLESPNKVYALIGNLVGNKKLFHQTGADGHSEAYQFVADILSELDAINPQVAGKMARSVMGPAARYTPEIRDRMREDILERIRHTRGDAMSYDMIGVLNEIAKALPPKATIQAGAEAAHDSLSRGDGRSAA